LTSFSRGKIREEKSKSEVMSGFLSRLASKTTSGRLFQSAGDKRRIEPGKEVEWLEESIAFVTSRLECEVFDQPEEKKCEAYVWALVTTIKNLQSLLEFKHSPIEDSEAVEHCKNTWNDLFTKLNRVTDVTSSGEVRCEEEHHVFPASARNLIQKTGKNRLIMATQPITDPEEKDRVLKSREELGYKAAIEEWRILVDYLREDTAQEKLAGRFGRFFTGKKRVKKSSPGDDDDDDDDNGEYQDANMDIGDDYQDDDDYQDANADFDGGKKRKLLGGLLKKIVRRGGTEDEEGDDEEDEEDDDEEEGGDAEGDTDELVKLYKKGVKLLVAEEKEEAGFRAAFSFVKNIGTKIGTKMRAALSRIEPNSTSGMLVGCVGFVIWLTYAGHSMTWFLCSNLTAKLPSVAYKDVLSDADKKIMEKKKSEMEKVIFLNAKIGEMSEEVKKKKFLEVLRKGENDVRFVGTRERKEIGGSGKVEISSENPFMSKIVNYMFGLDKSVLIDNAGAGAFKNEKKKDSVLGTFKVRAFDKISKLMEKTRIKLIVLNDTFHFWLSEGAWGGICNLQEFLDQGWTVCKVHPDAFERIKFKNRKGDLESATNMLLRWSIFSNVKKYMKSWHGYYVCYKRIPSATEEVYEVRWLLNIISLCRFGHLRLWLLNDYRELLATINVFRYLRGKRMWDYNQNPLTWADDKRSDGKFLVRPFLGPKLDYDRTPSYSELHPLNEEIRAILGRLP